ncbi:MAG: hypothetical protein U9Q22_03620, partial [Candidatus Altiarchaeota archaeon]|nr:hypothetical protein [Candidatus Altiarchaeota archaeon]
NHGKIFVSLVIPVTLALCGFIVASTINCNSDLYCAIAGVPFLISLILGVILQLPVLIFGYPIDIIYNFHSLENILAQVLLIFYWYFLSCTIISIFEKFRK